MDKSKFQFSNPVIENISFNKNSSYDGKPIDFQYRIGNSIRVQKSQSEDIAKVYLDLKIGNDTDKCPFELTITMSAKFKWKENVEGKQLESLLSKNAPALLLSYLRPVVSLLLSQAGFPNFNIPFADFTGELSDKE